MANVIAISNLSRSREAVRRQREILRVTPTEAEALKFTAALIASYPGGSKMAEVGTYVRQLATALRGYPTAVCEQLLHPRHGVPGMLEGFPLPQIASINKIADGLIERRAAALRAAEAELETREARELKAPSVSPQERDRGIAAWEAIKRAAAARTVGERKASHVGPEYFGIDKAEADRMKLAAFTSFEVPESQNANEDETATQE